MSDFPTAMNTETADYSTVYSSSDKVENVIEHYQTHFDEIKKYARNYRIFLIRQKAQWF